MTKKWAIAIVAVIAAFLVYWFYFHAAAQSGAPGGAAGMQAPPPALVSTLSVQAQTINPRVALTGRASPYRQSEVRPLVTGIITERLFEEGTVVAQGQQLYQLHDERFKAALNSARANLQSAQANHKAIKAKAARLQALGKTQAVSEQDIDDVNAELDQARAAIAVSEADVELAQINLDYTQVKAPISGRIGPSFLTVGALVTGSQERAMAVITQLDPIYVDLQASEQQAQTIHSELARHGRLSVQVTAAAGGQTAEPIRGELEFSDVVIDPSTGSVTLRALIENSDLALLPGLFVKAEVALAEQTVLLVPQRATSRNPSGVLNVWVVDENQTAQMRSLQASRTHGANWIVESGLAAGDRVVVEGHHRLRPGAPVNASPWSGSGPAANAATE